MNDLKLVVVAVGQPPCVACNPQIDRKVVKALADAPEAMKTDGPAWRITAARETRFAR